MKARISVNKENGVQGKGEGKDLGSHVVRETEKMFSHPVD